MELYPVSFETNIDAYSHRTYPTVLKFRPMVGDAVPFAGQDHFKGLPLLTITSIAYVFNKHGEFAGFKCNLYFSKNVHPEIARKILNHEVG